MTERRPQDRADALALLAVNANLDLGAVREPLARIVERGFQRHQDLTAKLEKVLADARD